MFKWFNIFSNYFYIQSTNSNHGVLPLVLMEPFMHLHERIKPHFA